MAGTFISFEKFTRRTCGLLPPLRSCLSGGGPIAVQPQPKEFYDDAYKRMDGWMGGVGMWIWTVIGVLVLEKGMKPEDLPVKVWRGSKIPADVRAAINAENLIDIGSVYGDKKAGDPMEYDYLKLILTDDTVEITVYNRGIALFMSNDERVRRTHRVLCKLDGSGRD